MPLKYVPSPKPSPRDSWDPRARMEMAEGAKMQPPAEKKGTAHPLVACSTLCQTWLGIGAISYFIFVY